MATKVQIELSVDESGAIAGLRAFESQVDKTASKIHLVGDAGNRASNSSRQLGKDGADAQDKIGAHALSAHDKLRIMERTLGVEIPKSMGKVILQSELAVSAISGLSTAMIAIGGIEIFAATAKEAYEFYEKLTDVNSAMREYTAEAAKASQQKLFSTASIESVNTMLAQAERRLAEIQQQQKAAGVDESGKGSVLQYVNYAARLSSDEGPSPEDIAKMAHGPSPFYTGSNDKSKAQTSAEIEQLKSRKELLEVTSELNRAESEAQLRAASAKNAPSRDAVELDNAKTIADLTRKQTRAQEKFERDRIEQARADQVKQNPKMTEDDPKRIRSYAIDPNAGQKAYEEAVSKAQSEYSAKRVQTSREEQAAITRFRNEALDASLRGEDLYEAQRKQALADFDKQYGTSTKAHDEIDRAHDEINEKFHAEQMRRIDDESRASLMRAQVASDAGKTGLSGIQARGTERLQEIANTPYSDSTNRTRDVESAQKQTGAEITASQRTFNEQLDSMDRQRQEQQLSGFGRLRAETDSLLSDLDRKYDDYYGVRGQRDARYYQERRQIEQAAAKQEADLIRSTEDETRRIEEEAYRSGLSPMKAQSQQIYDEYNERLRQYKRTKDEELAYAKLSDDDKARIEDEYNRRVAAAGTDMNGKLQQQARETRDKLAGELEGLFSNPMDALKREGEKAAAKFSADAIMKLGGSKLPGVGGDEKNGMFGLFGNKKDRTRDIETAGRGATPTAATMSFSSATIYISGNVSLIGAASGMSTSASGAPFPQTTSSMNTALATPGMPLDASAGGAAPALQSGFSAGSSISGPDVQHDGLGGTLNANGSFTSASPGAVGSMGGDKAGSAMAGISSGMDLFGQGKNIFGKKSSAAQGLDLEHDSLSGTLNEDGSFTNAGTKNNGMLGGGGVKNNAMGAASGAMGMFSAYEGNGGVGGAISGAMSGMQLGGSLGGPIGAAVGAAAGAIVGVMGFGGRGKAEKYNNETVKPRISDDEHAFDTGTSDYLTTFSDLDSLQAEAKKTVKQWGPGAESYYNDDIKKEITQAQTKLTREQKAGRSAFTMSAAQYHTGYEVDNFGNLATSSTEGFVHAQIGEYIVKPGVAARNRSALDALQSGASMESVASSYRQTMQNAAQQSSTGGDRTMNLNVYAHDSKSVAKFFSDNKHHIRSAMNDSQGEYGGQADG